MIHDYSFTTPSPCCNNAQTALFGQTGAELSRSLPGWFFPGPKHSKQQKIPGKQYDIPTSMKDVLEVAILFQYLEISFGFLERCPFLCVFAFFDSRRISRWKIHAAAAEHHCSWILPVAIVARSPQRIPPFSAVP